MMKLTNAKVKALQPPANKTQEFYWDSEARGFGLRITSAGAKSWVVQGRVNGKTRRFTIGAFELLSSDEARKRALQKLLEMYDGVDPQLERRKYKAQAETLREVMLDYIQHKRTKHGSLRPSSKADLERCVNTTFADWADLPITAITRDACIKRFRALSESAPIQTNQSFRNLRALFNWAKEKNVTPDGTYSILAINPVSQMFKSGGLVQWNKESARATRIPRDKIGLVWSLLMEYSNPDNHITTTCVSADLIAFMLLTGARIGEASKLTWDRVDLDSSLPTFHFDETKNHNPITLPIGSVLHEVLKRRLLARQKGNNFVFPALRGKKGYMSDPRAVFVKLSESVGTHLHPHSLRRTFEDIAQICNIDGDKRRQLLNHLANDVHGAAYANNPDPSSLLDAVEKIGKWVVGQANST